MRSIHGDRDVLSLENEGAVVVVYDKHVRVGGQVVSELLGTFSAENIPGGIVRTGREHNGPYSHQGRGEVRGDRSVLVDGHTHRCEAHRPE